jgi:hypothetical protein
MYWLASPADRKRLTTISRFDPRFWTIDFPRPMMAALTTPAPDALSVDLVFYRKDDLAGLIWWSEDSLDPPAHGYETRRDYSGLTLAFDWLSSAIKPLDEVNGPTLTIEGRDALGAPRTWFVRLWNYASGTPQSARITLDFDALDGGFLLPAEADPVYPKDIDRMFISLIPEAFDGVSSGPLENPPGTYVAVNATLNITNITLSGAGTSLTIGNGWILPHRLRLANGYDDTYNITPARLLRNALLLGYRDKIVHYVGMSHFYAVAWDAGESRFIITPASPLNPATQKWHEDFFARATGLGFDVVVSLSFELLDQNIPADWRQQAHDGATALTGWSPPSSLIPPTHTAATAYLRDVYLALCALMATASGEIITQIGEPWWWHNADGAPCFYDATTQALYTSETGRAVPAKHLSITETPTADQQLYLDWLGGKLGAATLFLRDAIKGAHAGAEVSVLFYAPQVFQSGAPMLPDVNYPTADWAFPAFDFFQIEDYDFVIAGDWASHDSAMAQILSSLGYPTAQAHYFSGFNLLAQTSYLWANIDRAITDANGRNFAEVFVWAYSQVARDGFVYFEQQEADVPGFHEVRFPTTIGYGATGGPQFFTEIIVTRSGHEQRNVAWSQARARYNAGSGLKSESDLADLIAFIPRPRRPRLWFPFQGLGRLSLLAPRYRPRRHRSNDCHRRRSGDHLPVDQNLYQRPPDPCAPHHQAGRWQRADRA